MPMIKQLLIVMIIFLLNEAKEQGISDQKHYEGIPDIKCASKNCLSCNTKNECIKCKPIFVLFNKRCYSNQCELYGECLYCTDYDCVQCHQGFKVAYGFCEEASFFSEKMNILLIITASIACIIILIIVMFFCRKVNKENRELVTAKKLTSKHLNGQYIIINPQNNNYIFNSINNSNNQSSYSNSIQLIKEGHQELNNIEMIDDNLKPVSSFIRAQKNRKGFMNLNDISSTNDSQSKRNKPLNVCVICNSNKLHSFANCGCGICLKDYNNIVQKNKKYICFLHKTLIQEGYMFMKEKTALITPIKDDDDNENSSDKKDKDICPICQISPGTFGFNCGCPLLLCAKCFNDNMNMFKMRQCPGCKTAYKEKKRKER